MYVNPFLMGVMCTVFFEVVAVVLYGMIFGRRGNEEEDEQEEQHENK